MVKKFQKEDYKELILTYMKNSSILTASVPFTKLPLHRLGVVKVSTGVLQLEKLSVVTR